MALSAVWSLSVVRDDIIREAMLNIGAIGEGEVPTAQEVTDCARKLNMMVKSWMGFQDFAPGLKMWERRRADLFMTSNRGIYTLGGSNTDHWADSVTLGNVGDNVDQNTLTTAATTSATVLNVSDTSQISNGDIIGVEGPVDIFWSTVLSKTTTTVTMTSGLTVGSDSGSLVWTYSVTGQRPLAIVTAVLRDQFFQDIPIRSMTLQEYEALPTKASSAYISDPTAFYYESNFEVGTSNQGGGQIYLDIGGAQDITKRLHIVYMRPIMDLVNPGDNPEYPQQWYRALCWGLSREICGMFDATWTQDMEESRKEAIAFAKEADAETTGVYFQPNAIDPYGA